MTNAIDKKNCSTPNEPLCVCVYVCVYVCVCVCICVCVCVCACVADVGVCGCRNFLKWILPKTLGRSDTENVHGYNR